MFVFVVEKSFPHEGEEIIGIFDSFESAKNVAITTMKEEDNPFYDYSITKYELNSEPFSGVKEIYSVDTDKQVRLIYPVQTY